MVDGDLFDKLSKVGKVVRRHNDPFGGIQVGQLVYRDEGGANFAGSSSSRGIFSSYRR